MFWIFLWFGYIGVFAACSSQSKHTATLWVGTYGNVIAGENLIKVMDCTFPSTQNGVQACVSINVDSWIGSVIVLEGDKEKEYGFCKLMEGRSPEKSGLCDLKDGTYNWIINQLGDIVTGEVRSALEWETSHIGLANGDFVFAAGSLQIESGEMSWNLNSSTFMNKIVNETFFKQTGHYIEEGDIPAIQKAKNNISVPALSTYFKNEGSCFKKITPMVNYPVTPLIGDVMSVTDVTDFCHDKTKDRSYYCTHPVIPFPDVNAFYMKQHDDQSDKLYGKPACETNFESRSYYVSLFGSDANNDCRDENNTCLHLYRVSQVMTQGIEARIRVKVGTVVNRAVTMDMKSGSVIIESYDPSRKARIKVQSPGSLTLLCDDGFDCMLSNIRFTVRGTSAGTILDIPSVVGVDFEELVVDHWDNIKISKSMNHSTMLDVRVTYQSNWTINVPSFVIGIVGDKFVAFDSSFSISSDVKSNYPPSFIFAYGERNYKIEVDVFFLSCEFSSSESTLLIGPTAYNRYISHVFVQDSTFDSILGLLQVSGNGIAYSHTDIEIRDSTFTNVQYIVINFRYNTGRYFRAFGYVQSITMTDSKFEKFGSIVSPYQGISTCSVSQITGNNCHFSEMQSVLNFGVAQIPEIVMKVAFSNSKFLKGMKDNMYGSFTFFNQPVDLTFHNALFEGGEHSAIVIWDNTISTNDTLIMTDTVITGMDLTNQSKQAVYPSYPQFYGSLVTLGYSRTGSDQNVAKFTNTEISGNVGLPSAAVFLHQGQLFLTKSKILDNHVTYASTCKTPLTLPYGIGGVSCENPNGFAEEFTRNVIFNDAESEILGNTWCGVVSNCNNTAYEENNCNLVVKKTGSQYDCPKK